MPGEESEIEIRPVYELEDLMPGEAAERSRKTGTGKNS
jgi:hypothetical protein